MRIAIPVTDGHLAMHFGHCETFELIDVEEDSKETIRTERVTAPAHQPGLLPRWLARHGTNVVIAGGMGGRALSLFSEQGIRVIVGAPENTPEAIVEAFLAGTLESGGNVCDH